MVVDRVEANKYGRVKFFAYPYFAVVGPSNDPSDYSTNMVSLVDWFQGSSLAVTPIDPDGGTISAFDGPVTTVPDIGALPNPSETALCIITEPGKTLELLRQAEELDFPAVWLQPGSFDDEVEDNLLEEPPFETCVFGEWGGGERDGGWCVLCDGDEALKWLKSDPENFT